jgi:hypothetical protein
VEERACGDKRRCVLGGGGRGTDVVVGGSQALEGGKIGRSGRVGRHKGFGVKKTQSGGQTRIESFLSKSKD